LKVKANREIISTIISFRDATVFAVSGKALTSIDAALTSSNNKPCQRSFDLQIVPSKEEFS
jgi:hypothetical protein